MQPELPMDHPDYDPHPMRSAMAREYDRLIDEQDLLIRGATDGALCDGDAAALRAKQERCELLQRRIAEYDERQERIAQVAAARAEVFGGGAAGSTRRTGLDGGDHTRRAGGEGHRTVEHLRAAGRLDDAAAEAATRLVEVGEPQTRSRHATWLDVTGSPEYRSALFYLLMDPQRGHMRWSPAERVAYSEAEELRAAMSVGTPSAGGYLAPADLEAALMLTGSGFVSPLRSRARVVTTQSGTWSGITAGDVTAQWRTPEFESATETTTTLGNPEIPVHSLSVLVRYSVELENSAPESFWNDLRMVMGEAAAQATEQAYTLGTGVNQPAGVIRGLAAAPGSVVTPAVVETLSASDFYEMQNSLGPRWQANASWMMGLPIMNSARQMETSNGALRFPELRGTPPMLLGREVDESSIMDSSVNPAVTGDNYVAVYGDLRSAFVIADQVGARIELIPHFQSTAGEYAGERALWLHLRTGSAVVRPDAARVLNVETTA